MRARHVPAFCIALFASASADAMPPLPLANAVQRAMSSSCVAAALSADGASLYRSSFLPDGVTGSLKRFELQIDSAGRAGLADQASWDAGALLEAVSPASRPVFTARTGGDGGLRIIPFAWDALGDAQRQALDASADGIRDGMGRLRLDYLRGARDAEQGEANGVLRKRGGLLGATVGGAPLPAGRGAHAAVHLAANDGMLHAFDADSGAELFAYAPAAIAPRWSRIAAPQYRFASFVEGALVAGAAEVGGKRITVLAGGMGSAARGVFALDVSDPAHFGDKGAVLFEFTERDDADIGHVFGAPQLARVRIGAAAAADYLVVGGGYNAGGRGRIALFLLSLNKSPADAWQLNANYFKWLAPVDDALPNGLAPAALAADEAGNARYAYAGDLQGNLWRFDLGDFTSANAAARKPVFIASDVSGRRQPITAVPRVSYAPDGLLLMFGTGSLLATGDGLDRSRQTLYAVRDHGMATEAASRARLVEHLLAIDGSYRLANSAADDGWYLDLPGAGERIVWNLAQEGSALVAASVIPRGAACAADARLYWLDALSGKPAPGIDAPFLLPADSIGRAPLLLRQHEVAPANGRGQRAILTRRRLVGTGAPASVPQGAASSAAGRAGRLGWREIHDVGSLRDAAP